MTKVKMIAAGLIVAAGILIFDQTRVLSEPGGSPDPACGAPADGNATCWQSGCHTGADATPQDGLISSNVPAEGYTPGSTYTITVSITEAGISKWGFMISPQNLAGQLKGTLQITNTQQTKIALTKYVTHKSAGNTGSGSRTWSFNWVAPAAGTGAVDFYGCVMAANNNTNEAGDHGYTDVLTINEAVVTKVFNPEILALQVYPNPVEGGILQYANLPETSSQAYIFDATGRQVASMPVAFTHGSIDVSDMKPGVYFVVFQGNHPQVTKRVVIH